MSHRETEERPARSVKGRPAQELIDCADLVTEMKLIKHPYKEKDIRAQQGIEF